MKKKESKKEFEEAVEEVILNNFVDGMRSGAGVMLFTLIEVIERSGIDFVRKELLQSIDSDELVNAAVKDSLFLKKNDLHANKIKKIFTELSKIFNEK